ncbi:DUF1435 domain-containing protein [Enterobacter kobei]|jgi:hypothetical protein|uniref:DUF1435 domain-containing protein n=2 Tax=Enterobacter kobei TaxID=208224 RepID=UPI001011352B|nr:DUF1435 domain-containing protein [Enterobacter kobei]WNP34083.1 DUF1435 domain-containing protein [Enterobacter kobei]
MILVIIITVRGESMLQRALGSGWGLLLAGLIVTGLAYADLSLNTWRMLIVLGLVLTPVMLYHKQLRHFVLLPSGIALVSGMMMLLMNLKRVM